MRQLFHLEQLMSRPRRGVEDGRLCIADRLTERAVGGVVGNVVLAGMAGRPCSLAGRPRTRGVTSSK